MKKIIAVNKPVGLTPLQTIEHLKNQFTDYKNEKIGYAGRLDPMAEGLLLLLIGKNNQNKEQFEKLDKEYIFEAVLGFETDSYDLLGIVKSTVSLNTFIEESDIIHYISTFKGEITQFYPPYSSVRVHGKPLFHWAFHNKLDSITIPQKKVTIFDIRFLAMELISAEELEKNIIRKISLVDGNFRQQDILKAWDLFFRQNKKPTFPIIKVITTCSSGTYIRTLVKNLGEKLGTSATTYSIQRTRVGEYTLDHAITLL